MELYIQITDGKPNGHPADESNLLDAFGVVPSGWEPFERVVRPRVGVYQILESETPTYEKVNNVWKDVWALRNMTEAEIAAKKQATKTAWAADPQSANWAGWLFSEERCEYYAPVPYPRIGGPYKWCGAENNWKEFPPQPQDGGVYKFDYFQWIWVAV